MFLNVSGFRVCMIENGDEIYVVVYFVAYFLIFPWNANFNW